MAGQQIGIDRKFSVDVIWNMGSLAFLAVAGLALNLIIGRFYGPQTLGLFNIAFAIYIFLSQFAVFGLHMSILRHVSEHREENQTELDGAVMHGLVAVTVIALLVSLIGLLATPLVAAVYKNPHMSTAYIILLPGLFAFAVNKYLLAVINGARHMRAFAFLQSLRFVLIFLALIAILFTELNGEILTVIISFSEIVLLPLLLIYVFVVGRIVKDRHVSLKSPWLFRHLQFGARAFLSGTVTELNTRVDILMIGAFLGATPAGIYSIAILIVEGLSQVIIVVRNNVNPLLTPLVLKGQHEEFTHFTRKVSLFFSLFMILSGGLILTAFPFVADVIFSDNSFDAAYVPLIVLTLGLVLASPYLPFNMILSQSDRPGTHTVYMLGVLLCNILFNLVAIPYAGINGAAFATALSYLASVVLLIYLSHRYLHVKIWL